MLLDQKAYWYPTAHNHWMVVELMVAEGILQEKAESAERGFAKDGVFFNDIVSPEEAPFLREEILADVRDGMERILNAQKK